ncbi:MAG: GNAT family N-acetyltransferase [Candidatus Improbicoccus devescovinae]|nr:MAG: GNAT family N-acetyltransferase [Candidatus Improbicoccus devescovinae]
MKLNIKSIILTSLGFLFCIQSLFIEVKISAKPSAPTYSQNAVDPHAPNEQLFDSEAAKNKAFLNMSEKTGIPLQDLQTMLTFSGKNKKKYTIVPFHNNRDYAELYVDLNSNPRNRAYMEHYNLGPLMKPDEAESRFKYLASNPPDVFAFVCTGPRNQPKTTDARVIPVPPDADPDTSLTSADNTESPQIPVGVITFTQYGRTSCWISYFVAKEYTGRGIATGMLNGALQVLQEAKKNDKIHFVRICTTVHPENIASIKMLEAQGFESELRYYGTYPEKLYYYKRNILLNNEKEKSSIIFA